MNNTKFIDDCFKFLTLLFWPIVWYNSVVIPKFQTEIIMFTSFTLLSVIYIFLILYNLKKFPKIVNLYRVSTLVTFILFLCSYLLFSKSMLLLSLKFIFILIYFYISFIKNFKYKMNEGVVGMLSALLLITITFSY
jgi:hypothetical protein